MRSRPPGAAAGARPRNLADRFGGGDEKVLNFLMGQVMKRTRGKANPGQVREALAARLKG